MTTLNRVLLLLITFNVTLATVVYINNKSSTSVVSAQSGLPVGCFVYATDTGICNEGCGQTTYDITGQSIIGEGTKGYTEQSIRCGTGSSCGSVPQVPTAEESTLR